MKKFILLGIMATFYMLSTVFAAVIEPASQKQTDIITKAIKDPITVTKTAAIKSSRHRNAYYVGIKFVAHELEMTGTGIWLVNGSASNPQAVFSVNATAIVFSRFPKSGRMKRPARMSDYEAKLILNYLKAD